MCRLLAFIIFILPLSSGYKCREPKDPGFCSPDSPAQPSMRYYFNADKLHGQGQCLPFVYSGCGGNNNNFETRVQCLDCLPQDGPGCFGNGAQPHLNLPPNSNNFDHANLYDCKFYDCPDGFECMIQIRGPWCCNSTAQAWWNEAQSRTCPNGKPAMSIFDGLWPTVFGENCKDLLCEEGYQCVQVNHLFAKCCAM